MKPLEITKLLFNDTALTPLSREFKAVFAYLNKIEKNLIKQDDEPVEEKKSMSRRKVFISYCQKLINTFRMRKTENSHLFPDVNKLTGTDEQKPSGFVKLY